MLDKKNKISLNNNFKNAYERVKEALLKRVAEEYFEEGLIKDNVYKALLTYKIDIDD